MEGWAKTLPADGDSGMRAYEFEKLVCGLVDLYQYGGVEAALPILERATTGVAVKSFDRTRAARDQLPCSRAVQIATRAKWYTLPENLYRAYLLTGQRALQAVRR